MSTRVLACLLSLACWITSDPLRAQTMEQIQTPEVREDALRRQSGILMGAVTVYPALDATIAYDDNVYATSVDKRDDIIASFSPEVLVRSNLKNQDFAVRAYYDRNIHFDLSTENFSQYGATANASVTVTQAIQLNASGSYRHSAESRRSLASNNASTSPVQFDDIDGSFGITRISGSLYLGGNVRARRITYGDAIVGGAPVDQRFRDFSILGGDLTVGYALHDLTRAVVQIGIERRRYDLRPGDAGFDPVTNLDRSANGYRIEAGIQRELTALLSGTIRIGYFDYDYADPTLLDVKGFSYYGDLRWSIDPLTTLTLSASRRLDETVSPISAGNLRDEIKFGANHELLRYLFLDASLRYDNIRSVGLGTDSREFGIETAARYYFGRYFTLEFNYSRASRSSDNGFMNFRNNEFALTLRIAR